MKSKNIQAKELLILRHGKSDWSTSDSDFDRPLKKRGQRNARQIGQWLVRQQLQPELIISSPAVRALSTARKVCTAMKQCEYSLIHSDTRLYDADSDALLSVLSEISDTTQRMLLVGHNPELEDLLFFLCPSVEIPEDAKLLPTAALAHFAISSSWHSLNPENAVLQQLIRARTLP